VRRLTLTIVVVALGVLAAAAWFLARRTSIDDSPRVGLTLVVNRQRLVEITPGTPIVFELSIGSSNEAPAFELGSRWRPWHALARLESLEGGGLHANAVSAGHRSLHLESHADGKSELRMVAGSVARLEAGRYVHTIIWTAAPENTSALAPGEYRVRGVLETPGWMVWGWRGRVVSPSVLITVRSAVGASELEARRLARSVEYFIGLERFSDAHAMASALVKLRPRDADSHILLGDALAGLNRRPEAFDAYLAAVSLLPHSSEDPMVLYRRMEALVDLASK
jgi:hypothetical protein